jgi:hypothetical protein
MLNGFVVTMGLAAVTIQLVNLPQYSNYRLCMVIF